ncbi:SRPBCC family protein [Edaphobacter albus]|uniref:SRPBCC family protein n=1 Tax=Edaphobacter sp. 4G125 TaxID=2763071 RepID=UPI0016448FEF|nr:hypothetical protein [Edaphobacter sp. 4G125]QNI37014.1 hypothetical protein H7846_01335 [Edaphobacter sp. 4G125]
MSSPVLPASGMRVGSLQAGDIIRWQMGLGKARLEYRSRIDIIRPYSYFREVMATKGIFLYYEHEHHFARMDDGTRVRNEIRFTTRLGVLGRPLELTLFRTGLMQMLARRNARLKAIAESNEWKGYLQVAPAVAGQGKSQEKFAVAEPQSRINMQRFA